MSKINWAKVQNIIKTRRYMVGKKTDRLMISQGGRFFNI